MHWHPLFRFGFSLLMPVVAAGYLVFGFIAYTKNPRVPGLAAATITSDGLARIKAGITSLSIIIVAISLYPAKSLISDIKSEEFWRILSRRKGGVPLSAINTISTPAESLLHSLMIVMKGYCSLYFSAGIVAGFVVIAVSALAPAILSADIYLQDGDVVALRVGSLPMDAIAITNSWHANGYSWVQPGDSVDNLGSAAAISAYVEGTGRFQSQIRAPGPEGDKHFVVPLPMYRQAGQSLRWVSDTFAYKPSCSIARTNITDVLQYESDPTSRPKIALLDDDILFSLPDIDWRLSKSNSSFRRISYVSTATQQGGEILPDDQPISGTTLWYLSNCVVNCTDVGELDYTLDLLTDGLLSRAKLELAFDHPNKFTVHRTAIYDGKPDLRGLTSLVIACKPIDVEVQTREVRLKSQDGTMALQPLVVGKPYKSQGNFDRTQAHLLFPAALDTFEKSGPTISGLESEVTSFELSMFFDSPALTAWNRSDPNTSATLNLLPMENATKKYASALTSAFQSYLAGQLGSILVPARAYSPVIVFTASLPPLISSTILFFILSCLIFTAHNRTGRGENFTLYTVAKALQRPLANEGSQAVAQNRAVVNKGEEEEVMDLIGDTQIMLLKDNEGVPVLFVDGEKLKRRNRLANDVEVARENPRGSSDEQGVLLQSTSERTSEIEKSGQSSNT